MKILFITVFLLYFLFSARVEATENGVLYEQWNPISGSRVDNLVSNPKFRKTPQKAYILDTFRNYDAGDNYGARYSAVLLPPATGNYTFWISSDDGSELAVSTDSAPDNLKKTAYVKGYTPPGIWDKQKTQKSAQVHLEAGKRYYLQVLLKEGGGNDHLEVVWQGPGISRSFIASEYLEVPPIKNSQFKAGVMQATKQRKAAEAAAEALLGASPDEIQQAVDAIPSGQRTLVAEFFYTLAKKIRANPEEADLRKAAKITQILKNITPSKAHQVTSPVLISLLFVESAYLHSLSLEELREFGAHRSAASMGRISPNAETVTETVFVSSAPDKGRNEMICTGMYALPGVPVFFQIADSWADKGLKVQIGHHVENEENYRKVKAFYSMPYTTWTKEINYKTTELVNPFGGLIFIIVPKGIGMKEEPVVISGAIKTPRFVLGKTTGREWRKIRNNPGPWGELVSARVVFITPSYLLRALDNPIELMKWWNNNIMKHEELYNYDIKVPLRIHVSYYPIRGCSTWPLYETDETMRDNFNLRSLKAFNCALCLHEHGHHADDSRMFFQNIGESSPNWGGYYIKGTQGDFDWKDTEEVHMLRLFDPDDEMMNNIKKDKWWTTKWTHYWSYPITTMMLGYVQGFGWQTFKKCVHRFTHSDDSVYKLPFCNLRNNPGGVGYGMKGDNIAEANQMIFDKWLIIMSEETKHDITPYMAHFYITPSKKCRDYINLLKYPEWDLVYVPERTVIAVPGKPVLLASPADYALTMAGKLKFKWTAEPAHGRLRNLEYTPSLSYTGEDVIPFVLTDKYGNNVEGKVRIMVVHESQQPRFSAGRVQNVKIGNWQKIRFPDLYRKPVLTASLDIGRDAAKYAVRIKNLSHTGFEITFQKTDDKAPPIAAAISWCVMEAGVYSPEKNGIRAQAAKITVKPEIPKDKMSPARVSLDKNWPALRDSSFAQIETCANSDWELPYIYKEYRTRCKAMGIAGLSRRMIKPEQLGYMFLKYGLYQFGSTNVKIMPVSITVGDVTVIPRILNKNDIRRMIPKEK